MSVDGVVVGVVGGCVVFEVVAVGGGVGVGVICYGVGVGCCCGITVFCWWCWCWCVVDVGVAGGVGWNGVDGVAGGDDCRVYVVADAEVDVLLLCCCD